MALLKHTLTRRDWDKRFGVWSALLAIMASVGTFAFDYHFLWLVFILVVPLWLLMRFSPPTAFDSPRISRWWLLYIPIIYLVIPMIMALVRYVLIDALR